MLVADGGKNLIVVAPNANAHVAAAEVDAMRPAFEQAGSALFQLQVNTDAVARAMKLARLSRLARLALGEGQGDV